MNTIGDMQNEKNFYGYYNEFEYNHINNNTIRYFNLHNY